MIYKMHLEHALLNHLTMAVAATATSRATIIMNQITIIVVVYIYDFVYDIRCINDIQMLHNA